MKLRKTITLLLALTIIAGFAADSTAEISNAAVLFLRIAPGSRASGMGEAYVAVADDATATHWNPAGLGMAPLSDTWIDTDVPASHRPLIDVAPLHRGGGRGYKAYDFWAISPQGLVRYDNRSWTVGEVFSTKTDETLFDKIRSYVRITDETLLADLAARVAQANNDGTKDELTALRTAILDQVPESNQDLERITADLDSLSLAYDGCRVNWDKIREAQVKLTEGLEDGTLDENDITRISIALERSRTRWLPEELNIPYSALFNGELTDLVSNDTLLFVASANGMAIYNGRFWKLFGATDGLPSTDITTMLAVGRNVVIGTDNGLAVFDGVKIDRLTREPAGLPEGRIQALGGNAMANLFAVVNGELFRFDGRVWKSTVGYQAVVDDTPERLAERFSLYGTDSEKQLYLAKYKAIFGPAEVPAAEETPDTAVEPDDDSVGAVEAEATEETMVAEAAVDVETAVTETAEAGGAFNIPGFDTPIEPGQIYEVPYLAGLEGEVNDIYVDTRNNIWLATEFGIFWFDGKGWSAPGYETTSFDVDYPMADLVAEKSAGDMAVADAYRAAVLVMNDLENPEVIPAGKQLRVPVNPAAAATNSISGNNDLLLFATTDGLIEYNGTEWARSSLKGMSEVEVVAVGNFGEEVWVASDRNLVIRGKGRLDISFMYVNWLPELADDLYYNFAAVTKPITGWGTVGFSVTHISYGTFNRTNEESPDIQSTFDAYDIALAGSYGTSLTNKLKAGITAKLILSHLADQGAGAEQGAGTASGFAVDFGLLYLINQRLALGLAVNNLGPKMAYIDAAQSDDLPRNLALGFSYKLLHSDYNQLIVTGELNKMLVGLGDGVSKELKETVFNGGAEFTYANLISARAGYIYDQEGSITTPTLGFGLRPIDLLQVDASYIPSQKDFALANTLRISFRLLL